MQAARSFIRPVAGATTAVLRRCRARPRRGPARRLRRRFVRSPPIRRPIRGPAAISFQLMPARLPLGTGAAGRLLAAAGAGRAGLVVERPGGGERRCRRPGHRAGRRQRGRSPPSPGLRARRPGSPCIATDGGELGRRLIDTALAAGTIDAEQALTYRVFALFADPRLPAQFEGAPEGVADHALMRRLSVALPTLSAGDARPPRAVPGAADLCRELVRAAPRPARRRPRQARATAPRRHGRRPAPGEQRQLRGPGAAGLLEAALDRALQRLPPGARRSALRRLLPRRRRGHRLRGRGGLRQRDRPAATLSARRHAEACNGGDGAVDIYVASLGHGDTRALTTTYPGRCNHVPSYIVVNSNDQALQQLRQNPPDGNPRAEGDPGARDRPRAAVRDGPHRRRLRRVRMARRGDRRVGDGLRRSGLEPRGRRLQGRPRLSAKRSTSTRSTCTATTWRRSRSPAWPATAA